MADVTLQLPDGSSVQYQGVPDGTTDAELKARYVKDHGEPKPASTWDKVKDFGGVVRDAGLRGIAGGAAGPLDALVSDKLPPTLGGLVAKGMQKAGELVTGPRAPGLEPPPTLTDATNAYGKRPQKGNTLQEYAASGAEGLGSAVTNPLLGAAPARFLLGGLASGFGGEAGDKLSNGNPLGRFVGSILGGLGMNTGMGMLAGARPQSADIARQAMEGVSPQQLQQAAMIQAKAKVDGVPIDLAQALSLTGANAGGLSAIRNLLANNQSGDKTQALLRAQPAQLSVVADQTVGKLPGPTWPMDQAANATADTATKYIKSLTSARTNAVQADYKKAGDLPEPTREALIALAKSRLGQESATDALKGAANSLLTRIGGSADDAGLAAAQAKVQAATTPLERSKAHQAVKDAVLAAENAKAAPISAIKADVAIGESVGPYKGTPISPVDPRSSGQVKEFGVSANRILGEGSSELAAAQSKYSQISREIVDPAKQGPTGQLATRAGAKPDVQASTARLEGIFSAGSDAQIPDRARSITRLAEELKTIDKDAFPAAAKAFIRGRLDKAFSAPIGDAPADANAAQNVMNGLFKDRSQLQGMKDIASNIARSYDLPEADLVRGVENLAKLAKAASNRPGSVGGMSSAEIREMAGSNLLANSARIFSFLPAEKLARGLEKATMGATYRQFDDLLTSPSGAKALAELGKTPTLSKSSVAALSTFFGARQDMPEQLDK